MKPIVNMLKNAFEATEPGGTVELGCELQGRACRFFVSNAETIPPNVASKVFERSFSTKSDVGRGLGTYSMKLFGERILKGKVSFTTSEEYGTTFFIELPVEK